MFNKYLPNIYMSKQITDIIVNFLVSYSGLRVLIYFDETDFFFFF